MTASAKIVAPSIVQFLVNKSCGLGVCQRLHYQLVLLLKVKSLATLACILVGVVVGVRRDIPVDPSAVALTPAANYTCPQSSMYRNDTTAEFFTSTRQAGKAWPVFNLEMPTNQTEFMCGLANRALPADCNCGFLFKWTDPVMKTFQFRSIPFDSEIYFLDRVRTVVGISAQPAYSQTPVTSPADIEFAIIVQSGALNATGVGLGDPVRLGDFNGINEGSTRVLIDDLVGMHN